MWNLTPLEIEALSLSLRVALWAVLFSLPLGILTALALARMTPVSKSMTTK